jgi:hypothetical protein
VPPSSRISRWRLAALPKRRQALFFSAIMLPEVVRLPAAS